MDLNSSADRYSYAKHYTPLKHSVEIAKFIRDELARFPSKISLIDPACGNMDLLRAFNMVFGDRQLRPIGIDIHPELRLPYPVIKGNAFQSAKSHYGKFDVCITNPPFGRKGHPNLDQKTQAHMDDFFFELIKTLGISKGRIQVTLELAFLGLVTKLLKPSGVCAIVLPESIFTCASYRDFRCSFEENFEIFGVQQLPVSAFAGSNASVSTAVLFFKNKKPQKETYSFKAKGEKGQIFKVIAGSGNWLPFKDIALMGPPESQKRLPWKSLGELFPHIQIKSGFKGKQPSVQNVLPKRGTWAKYVSSKQITSGQVRVDDAPYVELTDLLERTCAKAGDILLVRSGSGCLGRVAIVPPGRRQFVPRSEIYVLTGFRSEEERRLIYESVMIASIEGSLPWWSKILGRGVGTPNLNKEEILKIPVLDLTLSEIKKVKEKLKNGRKAAA
jgi:hypothetical protein